MSLTRNAPVDSSSVFVLLLTIRIANSALLRTFFQPDEYYQALEPAWDFLPGSHGAWMTWEWAQHLRSAAHPALFSVVYYIANAVTKLFDRPDVQDNILLLAPRVAQATIAALGDFYTWKLSSKVYGVPPLASITLYLTIANPWQWFCSTRTFSNGLENTLTVAALYYWLSTWSHTTEPLRTRKGKTSSSVSSIVQEPDTVATSYLRASLLLAATATILRPTNILVWLVPALMTVFQSDQETVSRSTRPRDTSQPSNDNFRSRLFQLARESSISGTVVLTLSACIDRAFYSTWTIPALNFLYFNVVQSLAVFYGNNDWHYYLSQGYPLLLTTALPFAIMGLYNIFAGSPSFRHLTSHTKKSLTQLATICLVLPAALSVLSHKEVRFIYPLLGPLLVIATKPVQSFFQPLLVNPDASTVHSQTKAIRSSVLAVLLLLNVLIAGYTSITHNSGIITLTDYFREEFLTYYTPFTSTTAATVDSLPPPSTAAPQNMTIGILMPCHSIPWRSHLLHAPTTSQPGIQAWALTCEPPLHLTSPAEKRTYLDEADIFYADPALWLRKNMSRRPPATYKNATTAIDTNIDNLSPGVLPVISIPSSQRNKKLWSSPHPLSPSSDHHQAQPQAQDFTFHAGIDITDLLPYLRTTPDRPPLMSTLQPKGAPIRRPWPHYLAFFEQLEPVVDRTLRGSGYGECWRVFNSHWHDDWRRAGDVVVWCLFPERARGGNLKYQ